MVLQIGIVAGSTVFVYQYVYQLPGIYWFLTICAVCLVIGLTIDYDVFLISRIYEFRHRGFTTEASILRAMATQSSTITTAGLIMTLAFSSLLLSDTTVLNQFGFVLCISAIVDATIVRSVLVPSLMQMCVEQVWRPRKYPPPTKFRDMNPAVN